MATRYQSLRNQMNSANLLAGLIAGGLLPAAQADQPIKVPTTTMAGAGLAQKAGFQNADFVGGPMQAIEIKTKKPAPAPTPEELAIAREDKIRNATIDNDSFSHDVAQFYVENQDQIAFTDNSKTKLLNAAYLNVMSDKLLAGIVSAGADAPTLIKAKNHTTDYLKIGVGTAAVATTDNKFLQAGGFLGILSGAYNLLKGRGHGDEKVAPEVAVLAPLGVIDQFAISAFKETDTRKQSNAVENLLRSEMIVDFSRHLTDKIIESLPPKGNGEVDLADISNKFARNYSNAGVSAENITLALIETRHALLDDLIEGTDKPKPENQRRRLTEDRILEVGNKVVAQDSEGNDVTAKQLFATGFKDLLAVGHDIGFQKPRGPAADVGLAAADRADAPPATEAAGPALREGITEVSLTRTPRRGAPTVS